MGRCTDFLTSGFSRNLAADRNMSVKSLIVLSAVIIGSAWAAPKTIDRQQAKTEFHTESSTAEAAHDRVTSLPGARPEDLGFGLYSG